MILFIKINVFLCYSVSALVSVRGASKHRSLSDRQTILLFYSLDVDLLYGIFRIMGAYLLDHE